MNPLTLTVLTLLVVFTPSYYCINVTSCPVNLPDVTESLRQAVGGPDLPLGLRMTSNPGGSSFYNYACTTTVPVGACPNSNKESGTVQPQPQRSTAGSFDCGRVWKPLFYICLLAGIFMGLGMIALIVWLRIYCCRATANIPQSCEDKSPVETGVA